MAVKVKLTMKTREVKAIIRNATKQAISDSAEYILQESNKIVPLDEGTLQRSGEVDMMSVGDSHEASVSYDTPYATRLHENPQYNFQGGRKGKYLEKIIRSKRHKQKVMDRLERELKSKI